MTLLGRQKGAGKEREVWGEETVCGTYTGCTGLVGVEVGHMAKSLSDNTLFCARSSSRCFLHRPAKPSPIL